MDYLVCAGTAAMSEKTKKGPVRQPAKAPRVVRRSPRPEAVTVDHATLGMRQLYTRKTTAPAKLHARRVYQSPRERVQSSKNQYDLAVSSAPAEALGNNASPHRHLAISKSEGHVTTTTTNQQSSAEDTLSSPASLDRIAFEKSLRGFQVQVEELPEAVYFPPMSPIGPWMTSSPMPPSAVTEPLSPRSRLLAFSNETQPIPRCTSATVRKTAKPRRPRSSQPRPTPHDDLL
ncbi:hypothetical protein SPRG_13195 [Saprolegnia parasitica CBS 223.65]|uniref:Uncharacterized protein n=1 Tax=Saprolegnia parasitica (strain CBS 223.65) TaxID=695850 RepID=A0A067BSS4_SAPPC|nr:hypothetical protein SPRG_13195 [Saprolegnia parasitica CBS 223.65]KDO21303.1 hypothetical protein SPRG_13195 [Saprolegnia parasitica CBS 223.65]|eukprot:XP_012207959.1 hypothetical protein SPRG_13195 [Saprolegnia parasitica CBS 223.65]